MILEAKHVAYNSAEAYTWKKRKDRDYKCNVYLNFIEPVFAWF